jgi:hypothetical protein
MTMWLENLLGSRPRPVNSRVGASAPVRRASRSEFTHMKWLQSFNSGKNSRKEEGS